MKRILRTKPKSELRAAFEEAVETEVRMRLMDLSATLVRENAELKATVSGLTSYVAELEQRLEHMRSHVKKITGNSLGKKTKS